ncbi:MAG TPA: hypothetical protein VF176_04160 [Solirubrobacterales bacterium]
MEAGRDTRPPRGALIVVAVGLIGCVAAAWLSTDKPIGAAELEWVEKAPLPDPKPVAIPGGGEMRLSAVGIRATDPNAGGYTLYRVAGLLTIDAGSAVGQGRLRCAIGVPRQAIVAKTTETRAAYPRSSDELIKQGPPELNSLVEFSSHSTDLALVEVSDALGESYADERGIVVEWVPYRIGRQVWQWGLPPKRPKRDLRLPFLAIWRTTTTPQAKVACTIETGAGSATARTAGSL